MSSDSDEENEKALRQIEADFKMNAAKASLAEDESGKGSLTPSNERIKKKLTKKYKTRISRPMKQGKLKSDEIG